jgi:hypothetical protein
MRFGAISELPTRQYPGISARAKPEVKGVESEIKMLFDAR